MSYTYNNRCLMKDGKPYLPVMGEMHYSRYREDFWEESLRKMKAGGVKIVASYVIWIHHEEEEGVFDFTGCRDLGRFTALCRKVGLKLFLRLGPWAHGEVRNGGFPDWLLQKEIPLRCNDERYLSLVERFWKQVFEQVEGEMYRDGGPVIGIQIENEYGHVGGLQGEEGEQHMRTLTGLAKTIGFDVPLYTATGWGGAATGGLLPVMGGYCEAPWDQRLTEIEANDNYVFSGKRNDANIASDHRVNDTLTFRPEDFPYLTAELGGGLQPTHHRRPVAVGKDIGAMTIVKLGSGVSLIGYYMYHGGSNPRGRLSTLQESRATGYLNDLPEINYDFRAPIRQYGQISDTYKEIKLLALFLSDFGEDLAALPEEIDPKNVSPEDMHTLRTAWRHDETHGYVFFNNYQRGRRMDSRSQAVLEGRCRDTVYFPEMEIPSGAYGFFPYHMKMQAEDGKETELICGLASPLCMLRGGGEEAAVFYGDWEPEFRWKDGRRAKVIHLSRAEALDAWKVTLDRDYLVLSDQYVWEEDGRLTVTGGRETRVKVWPELPDGIPGFLLSGSEGIFSCYERKMPGKRSSVGWRLVEEDEDTRTYEIRPEYGDHIKDLTVNLTYGGDSLRVLAGGELVNDHFYTGESVDLSMRYFDFPASLTVEIKRLRQGAPRFLERWPQMSDGGACRLENVEIRETFF